MITSTEPDKKKKFVNKNKATFEEDPRRKESGGVEKQTEGQDSNKQGQAIQQINKSIVSKLV